MCRKYLSKVRKTLPIMALKLIDQLLIILDNAADDATTDNDTAEYKETESEVAQGMGQAQDIQDEDSMYIGSDYVRMFRNLQWQEDLDQTTELDDENPHWHMIKAIKRPTRIRSPTQLIAALKKVNEFEVIDGYNDDAPNFYECYKAFIHELLPKVCIELVYVHPPIPW